jgi:hypothetical protein
VAKVHAGLQGFALAQRCADFEPDERLWVAVHAEHGTLNDRHAKARRREEADGQFEPCGLYLVIEVGEWEVGEVAPETLETRGSRKLGAKNDRTLRVVLVDETSEASELQNLAAQVSAVNVGPTTLDELVQVRERLQDAALAGAVAPKSSVSGAKSMR